MNRRYCEKIAVFDLDGTLYKDNSHIEILCSYYETNFFKRVPFIALGKISSKIQLKIMNLMYERIPCEIREKFILQFSPMVLKILKEKIDKGYFPLILSSAPFDLIKSAADCLKIEFYQCVAGKKSDALLQRFRFNQLFVCTDNRTDLELINLADEAVITAKKKHRDFFVKKIKGGNYIFLDI